MPKKRRNIEIRDLFDIKVVYEAEVSPDGTRIVLSIGQPDLAKNKNLAHLYSVSADGGPLRQLTSGEHVDRMPKWSPDGRSVAFISTRGKATCTYVMPMDGGEPTQLTDRDGDVSDFDWSPDGTRLVYAYRAKSERQKLQRDGKTDELARKPEFVYIKRLFHKLDGVGFWNGNYQQLYSIAAAGGTAKQLTRSAHDYLMPRYSPSGREIACLCNRLPDPDREVDNKDIFVVPAGGGRLRQVTRRYGPITGFAWSPDGKSFAFLGHMGKAGEFNLHSVHVWTIPAPGGTARNLTPKVDNHCFNLTLSDVTEINFDGAAPVWSYDGSKVYFTVGDRGACHLYEVQAVAGRGARRKADKQTGAFPGVTRRMGGDLCVAGFSRARNSDLTALVVTQSTNPSTVYAIDLLHADAEPRAITDVNGPLLASLRPSPPESVVCKDGAHEVHGWVVRPPDFKPGRRYPLILQIHGGPHTQYGHTFMHEFQFQAARGYVVLYTNPRGSIGYGLKHLTALHHRWGVPDYPDVMACVDQVIKAGYVDPQRLFVTGGSYGGFMTNVIVGKTDRFKAAITDRSVVHLTSMMASDFGHDLANEFGGAPWKVPDLYRKFSPLTRATRIKTPLLIIHSEQDLRCPIGQAEELFMTLKCLGHEVEFVRFIGESHGLSRAGRPQNRAERLRRNIAWFDKHLGRPSAATKTKPRRGEGREAE